MHGNVTLLHKTGIISWEKNGPDLQKDLDPKEVFHMEELRYL